MVKYGGKAVIRVALALLSPGLSLRRAVQFLKYSRMYN